MRRKLLENGIAVMALVAMSVIARLLPHAPNFTPLAATALFAGFWFRRTSVAVSVPIAAMLVSDAIIGFYDWRLMAVVYASLIVPVSLRRVIGDRVTPLRVGFCSLSSSATFFLATNFAVWLFGDFYPHTVGGLVACFAAGLSFFRYTLAGDLFWSGLLFGGYAVAASVAKSQAVRFATTASVPFSV